MKSRSTANGRIGNGTVGLSVAACATLLVLSGCPGSVVTNWPSQRLDNNPSTQPVAVEVGDMDSDGFPDVASVWRGATGTGSRPGAVAIHFQTGAGEWETTTVQTDTKYANANGLSLADVNLDGRTDILVAAHDRITYLRAPALPRVGANWTSYDIAASIRSDFRGWYDVVAAQIDNRFGPDIVATLNDPGRLVWFAAPENPDSSDGWQIYSIDSTTRGRADSLAVIDLNNDGRLDVVCSAPGDTSGVISWYEHPVDPTGNWPKHVMTSFSGATRFAMGDLNGDGLPDLVAVSPTSRRVAWFPHPEQVASKWNGWVLADYARLQGDQREPVDVAVADVNADGQLDVIVVTAEPAGAFWYTPREDNRLRWTEYRVAATMDNAYGLLDVHDTNLDGLPDLIVPIIHGTDHMLDRVTRYSHPIATGE
ncbi:MAG TPA: VCBS repeat-containing protein [Phycisphaerae bacterium]|nr:VCBS repeat-containing protein [Phycisphaerae bacterium]HOM49637.1 VCBS repeat-containing protein [Phycisphaerae bacterium]HON68391.1 VCBS repeat-containing protein [Phycisphaerae bacterium]HOQ84106.1 VCBS repeat-containing protein [Phycisphaerae bacterium]HPP25004.1 VCBS repeat-containing protein [Phycisphaerae bacterium]